MTTAIIVQARVGSTRFPGKVLKPLGSHTVLEEVLRRCHAVPGADIVVCAIPEGSGDDILLPVIERANAIVVRGSSLDVLSRYVRAAAAVKADVIMRVTSDCPLLDPVLCGDVLMLRAKENSDYVCNNMPPSFPHGLDCEAFTTRALMQADTNATQPEQREHVTPWLRETEGFTRANLQDPDGDLVHQRWTLDYADDYRFLSDLFRLLPQSKIPSWRKVAQFVATHPELAAINSSRHVR